MSPVGVGASRFTSALETGIAKLWVLLVGVDRYQDISLPSLRYAAVDCQGIADALAAATDLFPHKEFLIHHDLVAQTPTFATVLASLRHVVTAATAQDTVLIYFSGHGIVEPIGLETVLCLRDTDREHLSSTGLQIQVVLDLLGNCAAHSQLLWLDACHSGNLNLIGTKERRQAVADATPQLVALLSQRASQSRGFYALLSCDEGQQSWEFPDLGHGVFSYYLMRGLQGEAADLEGIIDADGLYRYVYRQTMQFIERTNQQIRLVNQANRARGEMIHTPEYSLQTPKRIVSGVGEIILGIQPQVTPPQPDRRAVIIDAGGDCLPPSSDLEALSHVLQAEGKFEVDYSPASSPTERIQTFLHGKITGINDRTNRSISTRLLYLRGHITTSEGEDAWLLMGDGLKLSRNWLRQQLQHAHRSQQILILDAPGATTITTAEWVAALKFTDERSQCIIACATPADDPELFTQVLLETLISAPLQLGVSVVNLFTRLQTNLDRLGVNCDLWLSGTQGLIEIVPGSAPDPVELSDLIEPMLSTSLRSVDSIPAPEPTYGQDDTVLQPAEVISASLFTDRVSSILYNLVGPIAPTLITQASNHAQIVDPTAIVNNLRSLLPTQSRADFEQQVTTLFSRSPASPPLPQIELASAKTSPPAIVTAPQPHFSPAARMAIATTLQAEIGPIARVLLGQIAATAWENDRSLLEALKPYLTADRLIAFAQEIQPILESATQLRSEPPAPSAFGASGRGTVMTQAVGIDDAALWLCERELTLAIGPIAKFIVASTHKANPQMSVLDFIVTLAHNIPATDRANTFRDRLQTELGDNFSSSH